MLDRSFSYSLSPPVNAGERLDFVFGHPAFDRVRAFRASDRSARLGPYLSVEPEYGLSVSGGETGDQGFLNVQHISAYGDVIFDPPTYLVDPTDKKTVHEGDLLIARTGFTLGKTAAIPEAFDGYAFGSFCLRFRVNERDFDPQFVASFLNTEIGRLQTTMLRTGSDKPNINSGQVADLCIPRIGIEEQRTALGEAAAIEAEATDRQRQASGVRAELTGGLLRMIGVEPPRQRPYFYKDGAEGKSLAFVVPATDLAERLGYLHYHPAHRTLLDALREAVETVPLAQVVREPIARGKQPVYDDEADRVVLKTVDIRDGWIDYDAARRVSDEFFEANPGAHVQHGDVLVTATGFGSMGKVAVYDRDEPALFTGELLRVRPLATYDPYFLASLLRSGIGAVQFDRWFSGSSGQIHVYEPDLERFEVPSPEAGGVLPAEQRRIAEHIRAQEAEARRLEAEAAERREAARQRFETLVLG